MTFNVMTGTGTGVEEAVDKLENAVGEGSFNFTLPAGLIVTADTDWFITYYDHVTPQSGNFYTYYGNGMATWCVCSCVCVNLSVCH